jgi:phenylpropionate dioxygenase-like ring-hydroxylating dioxygenase large terminal subunit
MNRPLKPQNWNARADAIPNDWDRSGLPGWTYHSPALCELEKEMLFRRHWQILCHVSDVPEAGNYLSFDQFGERALVVRGADGQVRAFHNMCMHRGSRVVSEERGICRGALVCPFHGWVYNLDGTLRGAARPETFSELDRKEFGLRPLETEIWNGLVFVRFAPGPRPSVAELLRPFEEEAHHYRMHDMVPTNGMWSQTLPVNWKSVRDVDNEGYHVAMAHPALQDLYGRTYRDQPFVDGVSRSHATANPDGGRLWSVRNYIRITEPRDHLPQKLHRAWLYYGIFPNMVIAVTPETMQFYQEFPVSEKKTVLRGAVYRHRVETRRQRLSRYLAYRIDRDTIAEDVQLTIWSNESMQSKAFPGFHLSDLEYGVRTHHDHVRATLPVTTLEEAPEEGAIAAVNAQMLA